MKLPALVLCFIQHLKAETSQVTIVQLLDRSRSQEPLNILIVLPSSPYPVTSAAGISQASANSTCPMSLSPSMEHPNKNVLAGTF
ncbi:hypothetical protein Peur_066871 [Populus x canadensis]